MWALLAGVIQSVTVLVVQHFGRRDFNDRIVRGEIAAATYMGSISLCVGILNAACMTN